MYRCCRSVYKVPTTAWERHKEKKNTTLPRNMEVEHAIGPLILKTIL